MPIMLSSLLTQNEIISVGNSTVTNAKQDRIVVLPINVHIAAQLAMEESTAIDERGTTEVVMGRTRRMEEQAVLTEVETRNRTLINKIYILGEAVKYYTNYDLDNIITPVNVDVLERLLIQSNYSTSETEFLVDGFRNGFPIGYHGPTNVKSYSQNLPLTVGSITELWQKMMTEVENKRFAGPFETIPFDHFIQSPVGLVPKDGGKKTQLIFHLSHPRLPSHVPQRSVNANTPEHLSKVNYPDFSEAIKLILKYMENDQCWGGKSDFKSVFRGLPIRAQDWRYLVMKAVNPLDNKTYFFIDKCLPFGASISCSHFQRFSNAIAHIVAYRSNRESINYLDDFFFTAFLAKICNAHIDIFLDVCGQINFPVALDKTFRATRQLTFLGFLIDMINKLVAVPVEKIQKAISMIDYILSKKKINLETLKKICGYLNFIARCVVPGRAFLRRLYSAGCGLTLPHHHLYVNKEMKLDLTMWKTFLLHPMVFCRSFEDFVHMKVEMPGIYSDASANPLLGCGGIWRNEWFAIQWETGFVEAKRPSIAYLELYGVVAAILHWLKHYQNTRIEVRCDNQSVVHMINNNSCR